VNGPAAPRVTLGHRFQDLLIRGVEGGVRLMPEAAVSSLGAALGRLAGGLLRVRRKVVEGNLRLAFPDRDDGWIRRTAAASYGHLGREGAALLRMGKLGSRAVWERTEVEGIEHLREPLSRDQGVILLTGHLGNWEIGGAAMAVREIPIDVVAKRQNNPLVDARLNRTRERLGMRVIDRDGGTKHILRSLSGGRVVALVADQNVRHAGVFVEFFGRPASTARGPALLAQRTGAAVVFASAIRLPGRRARYRVRLQPLEAPGAGDADTRARGLLRRYLAALETDIRLAPEQYLWAHKRWKTQPTDTGLQEQPPSTAVQTEGISPRRASAPAGTHEPAASPTREIP
jgi:Kdo2-lipid IVA lauroyltransferase/acyltransferase